MTTATGFPQLFFPLVFIPFDARHSTFRKVKTLDQQTTFIPSSPSQIDIAKLLSHPKNVLVDLNPAVSSSFLPSLGETKELLSCSVSCVSETIYTTHKVLHHECYFPDTDQVIILVQIIPFNPNLMDYSSLAGEEINILTQDQYNNPQISYEKFLAVYFLRSILSEAPYLSFDRALSQALAYLAEQGVRLQPHEKTQIDQSCLEILYPSCFRHELPVIRYADEESMLYRSMVRYLSRLQKNGLISSNRQELLSRVSLPNQFWGLYPEGPAYRFIQRIPGSLEFEEIILPCDADISLNLKSLTGLSHRLHLLKERHLLFDSREEALQARNLHVPYRLWLISDGLFNIHLDTGLIISVPVETANLYSIIEQIIQS